MVLQNYQNLIEINSNMIYIVAFGVGFKCPHKIHLNTQCPCSIEFLPARLIIFEILSPLLLYYIYFLLTLTKYTSIKLCRNFNDFLLNNMIKIVKKSFPFCFWPRPPACLLWLQICFPCSFIPSC